MMRGLPCLALSCALTLVIAPASAASSVDQPTAATPEPHATPTAKARDEAQIAFQRDLVSVLAPRADAMPLLAAALLARPLANQPRSNNFHALIGRAARADDTSAAISWIRLADCDAKADACPNTSALGKLLTQAPDNAAVWLLKLGVDTQLMKSDDARADLTRAAAARLYDDYAGDSLQALAGNVGVLPPPAATLDPANGAGATSVQLMLTYGVAGAQPQPGMPLLAQLCEKATEDASIKSDCLALAKVLEWGSSPLARSLGLHLREVLTDDPAQREDARRARIDLIWQVQNFAQLLDRARGDGVLAQHLLVLASKGGTEMSLLLAALRDNQIAASAPTDWKPRQPD
ncbi:MAG: hypothetical protein OQK79_08195 [Rhodanobacter sp.]|nr:hypothetical protein [Rhodanobacter sp.]